MFCLDNVTKVYSRRGTELTAIRAESLKLATGSYSAIVGPSGSGKTTLLSLLGGMLSPTSGRVLLDDVSLYDLPISARARLRREKIGFVFQTFNLVPYLTAEENVQVPLCLSGTPADEQKAKAVALLDLVGLADRIHHKPSELSIGQQQRVALARTLANSPTVILADEPTGNLDPDSRKVVLDFFDELHRDGCTIVMVTHDAVAADRAHNWLRLENGMLVPSPRSKAA
jgi:putative ABC transport system ATP-binding protein